MAMENKRIIQLNTERTTPAADDYVMVDSATAGTAKYLLPKITDAIDQEISDRTSADTALQTAITNETTARANADTTLQGNITAEATARAEADTAINGEITQLKEDLYPIATQVSTITFDKVATVTPNDSYRWATPSIKNGSTVTFTNHSSVALTLNVQDANSTEKGITTVPAGGSVTFVAPFDIAYIRSWVGSTSTYSVEVSYGFNEVSKVKEGLNDISHTILDGSELPVRVLLNDFMTGGLNNIDFYAPQQYRVTTYDIHEAENDIELEISDGFRIGWSSCDAQGTFTEFSGWKTGSANITKGTRFRLEIARTTENQSEIADVVEFTNAVTTPAYFSGYKDFESMLVKKNLIGNEPNKFYYAHIPLGSYITISTSDGSNFTTNYINLYDVNKNYMTQIGLASSHGSQRTVFAQSGLSGDIYYLVLAYEQPVPLQVEIGQKKTAYQEYHMSYDEVLDAVEDFENGIKTASGHWTKVCHRGYTMTGEVGNTIPAIVEAFNHGYSFCEGDVRITSDGYGIMAHDETLTGTINGVSTTLTVAETSLADLKQLVLNESETYGTVYPPTWEEFLECASLHGMTVVLDLYGNSQTATNITYIVNKALSYGMGGNVLYTPSSIEVAQNILALDKRARIRFYATSDYTNIQSLINGQNELIAIITPGSEYATTEKVLIARQAGLKTYIWNISSANYQTLFALYPDYAENVSAEQNMDYGERYISNKGF